MGGKHVRQQRFGLNDLDMWATHNLRIQGWLVKVATQMLGS